MEAVENQHISSTYYVADSVLLSSIHSLSSLCGVPARLILVSSFTDEGTDSGR